MAVTEPWTLRMPPDGDILAAATNSLIRSVIPNFIPKDPHLVAPLDRPSPQTGQGGGSHPGAHLGSRARRASWSTPGPTRDTTSGSAAQPLLAIDDRGMVAPPPADESERALRGSRRNTRPPRADPGPSGPALPALSPAHYGHVHGQQPTQPQQASRRSYQSRPPFHHAQQSYFHAHAPPREPFPAATPQAYGYSPSSQLVQPHSLTYAQPHYQTGSYTVSSSAQLPLLQSAPQYAFSPSYTAHDMASPGHYGTISSSDVSAYPAYKPLTSSDGAPTHSGYTPHPRSQASYPDSAQHPLHGPSQFSPQPQLSSQRPQQQQQQASPHAAQPYAPLHFTDPTASGSIYGYPHPHSFPHPSPSFQYPPSTPFGHQYHPGPPPSDDTSPGVWWYLATPPHVAAASPYPQGQPQYPSYSQPSLHISSIIAPQSETTFPYPTLSHSPPIPSSNSPSSSAPKQQPSPHSSTPPALSTAPAPTISARRRQSPHPSLRIAGPSPLGGAFSGNPAHTAHAVDRASPPSGSGSGSRARREILGGSATRKPYHPFPPSYRSEWVMWVGNVPSDATHDEVWKFFTMRYSSDPVPTLAALTAAVSLTSTPSPRRETGVSDESSTAGAHQPLTSLPLGPAPQHASPTQPGVGSGHEAGGNPSAAPDANGVLSIFLIARSNCSFVNFASKEQLNRAVDYFNGRQLRPGDPRCMRLVCRVRQRDDDLRAGVGGQRGMGMHVRWVREKEEREKATVGSIASDDRASLSPPFSSDSSPPVLRHATDEDEPPRPRPKLRRSNSSGESTDSSFLARHFPKRYFILKSLSQVELNLSVEQGLWATQPHNEPILDQAFRTSTDVYLIFSANKSGEFFGYAKMASPVPAQDARPQSLHLDLSPPSFGGVLCNPHARLAASAPTMIPEDPAEDDADAERGPDPPGEYPFFAKPLTSTPGEELAAPSTVPVSSSGASFDGYAAASSPPVGQVPHPVSMPASAPAAVGRQSFSPIAAKRRMAGSLDVQREPWRIGLSENPRYAAYLGQSSHAGDSSNRSQQGPGEAAGDATESAREERVGSWSNPFKVEWIRIGRLPFHKTRHIRNPWNGDREVKVSRDGTELEPTVGQRLLDEWNQLDRPASSGRSTRASSASARS